MLGVSKAKVAKGLLLMDGGGVTGPKVGCVSSPAEPGGLVSAAETCQRASSHGLGGAG